MDDFERELEARKRARYRSRSRSRSNSYGRRTPPSVLYLLERRGGDGHGTGKTENLILIFFPDREIQGFFTVTQENLWNGRKYF